eukprot:525521-Ditylum_brightwellii.AAC.1
MHVTATQLGAKVCGAVKNVQAQSKTGKKFITMTRWAQLSAGTGAPILSEIQFLLYLEEKRLHQLLEDMKGINCQIRLVNMWLLDLYREHDQFNMGVVLNSTLVDDSHL